MIDFEGVSEEERAAGRGVDLRWTRTGRGEGPVPLVVGGFVVEKTQDEVEEGSNDDDCSIHIWWPPFRSREA